MVFFQWVSSVHEGIPNKKRALRASLSGAGASKVAQHISNEALLHPRLNLPETSAPSSRHDYALRKKVKHSPRRRPLTRKTKNSNT